MESLQEEESELTAHCWVAFQHVAWEGPGMIGTIARSRGITIDVCRLDLTPVVPSLDGVEGLVVMGGPMGVYEADKYPFLADECHCIAEMVRAGRPVIGVCLGAQLLANALGARVYSGPEQEIGFGTVRLAPAAKDSIFAGDGDEIPVFHWHGDTFDLPAQATLLASSSKYAHQAFCVGPRVYGLQFHVEVDASTWSAWRPKLPPSVPDADNLRQPIERVGRDVIGRFFDAALARS